MDPHYSIPPPAYSEQEFDHKISQATALSLHTSQASLTNIDEDGFPQYNPAAFEATFASEGSTPQTIVEDSSPSPMRTSLGKKEDYIQHGMINNLPSVVPLRIEKKSQQKSNLPKPPISQARNESSSLTTGENPTPSLFYSGASNRDDFRSQLHSVQSTCAGDDVSLTISPAVHCTQIAPNHERDASLPSIPPPPPFEGRPSPFLPESSLVAQPYIYDSRYQQHVDPHNVTPIQSPRKSLPIQPRPRFVPQERPMSSYSPSNNSQSYVPRLDFNPSIAYGKTQPVAASTPMKQPVQNVQYDPHALYNSAVSAQMAPIAAGQHGHSSSYSSYNSRNSKQYQQHGSPATFSRPGHYSQSFISNDPPLERSSSPFEMNSSRQSALHPPARSSSSYSMSSNCQTFNTSPSPVYQYVNHTPNAPGSIYYDQQSAENRWSTQ